ncbi:WXG100 protein secretion system (Wss) [Corynebacterium mustelae]|uniref:WXG100 protein secretion system (Wss) n=1 Tax=Corynebacterium mustelae TaxID=571915 RepID=A0A0G3H2U3_9CORY|nr:EsaB/YukD family protein [Corynebacterium mustelae]AKK07100.1 WXG100 protein secretion system (Wss) [Corynebacterium mustelae]
MATVFIRLSVFYNDRQLDVSVPAHRPIVDVIDDITNLLGVPSVAPGSDDDPKADTQPWALSSPTKGLLDSELTLDDYSIVDGQRLYLTPQLAAAHSPFVDHAVPELRSAVAATTWRWADSTRATGYFIVATVLALLVYFPTLGAVYSAPNDFSAWSLPTIVPAAICLAITLIFLIAAFLQPVKPMRWLGLITPLTAIAATSPFLTPLPAGREWSGLVSVACIAAIPAALAAGRKTERTGRGGALALLLVALAGVALYTANYFGISALAFSAWGAWVPIVALIIAPSFAVKSAGLTALLRENDNGAAVSRTDIRRKAIKAATICDGLVWFATATAFFIIVTLASSPYWQQGILAAVLSIIMLLRTASFSDARRITPLILSGTVGLALCAAACVPWAKTFNDSEKPHNPWWLSAASDQWLTGAVFAGTCLLLVLAIILIAKRKPATTPTNSSSTIGTLDTIFTVAAIPVILVAQGVFSYFWALS